MPLHTPLSALEQHDEFIGRHIQVVVRLQTQPELGGRIKETGQAQGRLRGHTTLAEDNLVDAPGRHTDVQGEPVLAHIRPMLTDVFHIVAENKEICRVLLSDNGDIKFLQRLSDVIQEKLRTEWLNGYVDNETEFEYRYAFGALGFVGLLRTWLHRDCAESAEGMAVLADSLIRQGIMNSIPNLK